MLQSRHILLTALSPESRRVSYAYRGRRVVAEHASLALLQMLDGHARPGHVIAIVTAEARIKAWPEFRQQVARQIEREPEAVEVPDGRDEGEMREILERMAAALDRYPDAAVTMDITHGFRHFPLLAYVRMSNTLRLEKASDVGGLRTGGPRRRGWGCQVSGKLGDLTFDSAAQ